MRQYDNGHLLEREAFKSVDLNAKRDASKIKQKQNLFANQ